MEQTDQTDRLDRNDEIQPLSRREFLRTTATASAVGAAALMSTGNYAFAQGSGKIKVGLIGCGGRGTGAASDALDAGPDVVLTALGDVLQSQIDGAIANLKNISTVADRVQVKPDHCFVGLDAYQHVANSDVDVVLIAPPPGFHPQHIKAAVDAGKHVFAEKPMGADTANVHMAHEAALRAKDKGRCFVAGFCWRYDLPRREFYKRLLDGQIGEVRNVHATYLTSPVKPMPASQSRPAGMSDVEWQIRNWYNFVYLSGDGLVEQACHSVDKILWAMKDVPPAKAVATGGRVLSNGEGNIYDHIDVFYEWPDGTRATMAQRQIPTEHNDNSDYIACSKGIGIIKGFTSSPELRGEGSKWRYAGPNKSMYKVEHEFLFEAIRKGQVINDAERMWRSTLAGIMGRMAAYTGEEITWEQMLASREKLMPDHLDWSGSLAVAPMAVPGVTKFA